MLVNKIISSITILYLTFATHGCNTPTAQVASYTNEDLIPNLKLLSTSLETIYELPGEIITQLDTNRTIIKYREVASDSSTAYLIHSIDNIENNNKTYLRIFISMENDIYHIGLFDNILPAYFKNYSLEYVTKLPEEKRSNYIYWGVYPLDDIDYIDNILTLRIKTADGLGYELQYKITTTQPELRCVKSTIYSYRETEITGIVNRNLLLGTSLKDFSYEKIFTYFEEHESY